MGTSAAEARESPPGGGQPDRAPWSRQWKRSAGVVAAVALLVVGPARSAGASTPEHPGATADHATADQSTTDQRTAGQLTMDQSTANRSISHQATSHHLNRFSTLSSGSYTWHVASSPATPDPDRGQEDPEGPLHGEFPVIAIDGTVQTRRWQWGRVVTVADGWFAVTSDDGYSDAYVLDTGVDAGALTLGEQVTVVGVVDGVPPTAVTEAPSV